MIDREKVIKGLECCLGSNDCDVEPKEDCPYQGMCLCAMALRFDVLALLKEQEPKAAIITHQNEYCKDGNCPSCGHELDDNMHPKYCGYCGQEVKWDV